MESNSIGIISVVLIGIFFFLRCVDLVFCGYLGLGILIKGMYFVWFLKFFFLMLFYIVIVNFFVFFVFKV